VKTLRQQLFIAFLGIAFAIVAVFGMMSHFIATEYAAESEIHMLQSFVQEKAERLATELESTPSINHSQFFKQQASYLKLPLVLIDKQSRLVSSSHLAKNFNKEKIEDYFSSLPSNKTGGIFTLDDTKQMWRLSPVPNTNYRLILFHSEDKDVSFFKALGFKLFIAAFVITWISAWSSAVLANIISRKLDEQNAVLEHMGLHDQLTDLPNRHLIYKRLEHAIRYAEYARKPLALFLFELNNLKDINDTLGHTSGDELLTQIGPRLQVLLSENDTIARLDGGEFAVLVPGLEAEQTPQLAYKIQQVLDNPFPIEDMSIKTCACIGASIFPDHGDSPQELFRQADVAMSHSKLNNNEFFLYDRENDPNSIEQLTLMSELNDAILNNDLQLFYQPKIDLRQNTIIGVEALLRWFHPVHGLIPPDEFIPKAEQTAMIKPLTKWVIETATQQWAKWNTQGSPLQIAINVSQRSLYDRDLIHFIAEALQEIKLSQCCLDIEITETAVMAHPAQSLATLRLLSKMGIHLSIDDFGTGFTSLSYLKELPVNELKIDKSFIINMASDNTDIMIVRSIIELAHSLGRTVVAEGVENEDVLSLLRALNCDFVQGYHYAKPMSVDDFNDWLQSTDLTPVRYRSDTA